MRRPLLALSLLCGCAAAEGVTLFDGPLPERGDFARARIGRLPDGTLVVTIEQRGDSRTPADVRRGFAREVAQAAIDPHCSNGATRMAAPPDPTLRALSGTSVTISERSVWGCAPDSRSAEEIRAMRNPKPGQPLHRCGIGPYDFANGRPPPC